jgi:molybdate/tungstate transport system substrate-binding protein
MARVRELAGGAVAEWMDVVRRHGRRAAWTLVILLVGAIMGGCGGAAAPATADVLYAASLVQVMDQKLGPAFAKATGFAFQGEGKGSVAAANLMLDKQRTPDVFITPDAEVNGRLMGERNGDLVRWYVTFAGTEVVIGYNPRSRFAADLERARQGESPWYQVLQTPGLRIGRPDPELAPLGYRVLFALSLAEGYYSVPGLRARILGADQNQDQVFPSEELAARLEAGQLDVAFLYRATAVPIGLPYLTLPPEVSQGLLSLATLYASQSYRSEKKGVTYTGTPIVYTATVPENAKHPAAGRAFLLFLLGADGQAILKQAGLGAAEVLSGGDAAAIPAEVRALVRGAIPGA